MGTIAEKLQYTSDAVNAIKTAIIAKGVAVSDSDALNTYANKISNIPSTPSSNDYVGFNSGTIPYVYDDGNETNFSNNTTTTQIIIPNNSIKQADYTIEFCLLFNDLGYVSEGGGRIFELTPSNASGSSQSTLSINIHLTDSNYYIEVATRTSSATSTWDTTIEYTINTNTFHTFSAVVDNTNSMVYIYDNGILIKSYNINLYYTSNEYYLDLKYAPTSKRVVYGNGYMSRFYKRALSQAEVLQNYQTDYTNFANT